MACSTTPTVQLLKEGDYYTFNTISTFKNVVLKFKLGEEFNEEKPDGRQIPSIMTMEDNKLILIQRDGDKTIKTIREFTKDECVTYIYIGGVLKCTRWFIVMQ